MFGWRRRGRAAGASGSQIECLSVGLARVWRRNYRRRAASSGAEWKRRPKASGRGSELERRQWASALLSQGNQICISEDRRGRRRPATLHNCKLSIHGRPSPSSGPKASLSRQADRRADWQAARVYSCAVELRNTCYCAAATHFDLIYGPPSQTQCPRVGYPVIYTVATV